MIAAAICRVSEAADAAIASPWGLPAYVVARGLLAWSCSSAAITVIQSDFANVVLLLLAVSQAKRSHVLERQVDALADANPAVDNHTIRQEATP